MNQELKAQSLGVSVVLFLAGAGLLAVAYAMLLTRGLLRVDALFWVMIGLGSLGTCSSFAPCPGSFCGYARAASGSTTGTSICLSCGSSTPASTPPTAP